MISPNIIKFLTTLKENNNRDWFNKNKKWYQRSREEFKFIINHKEFKYNFREISGEKLKTFPRGFPGDFPEIELLKYKSYTVIKSVMDCFIQSEKLTEEITRVFKEMYPFNRFINMAIAENYRA